MSKFRKGDHPPPDGRVRQSQLLTTYGPGAMIDLLHEPRNAALRFCSIRSTHPRRSRACCSGLFQVTGTRLARGIASWLGCGPKANWRSDSYVQGCSAV